MAGLPTENHWLVHWFWFTNDHLHLSLLPQPLSPRLKTVIGLSSSPGPALSFQFLVVITIQLPGGQTLISSGVPLLVLAGLLPFLSQRAVPWRGLDT